jgi:hypothetical protein
MNRCIRGPYLKEMREPPPAKLVGRATRLWAVYLSSFISRFETFTVNEIWCRPISLILLLFVGKLIPYKSDADPSRLKPIRGVKNHCDFVPVVKYLTSLPTFQSSMLSRNRFYHRMYSRIDSSSEFCSPVLMRRNKMIQS